MYISSQMRRREDPSYFYSPNAVRCEYREQVVRREINICQLLQTDGRNKPPLFIRRNKEKFISIKFKIKSASLANKK
ncbi:hypothetical protein FGO68_gene2436 [Halteria grandinella]|uniref:Uncharacterized protein n=1 Tax=Halteria grandinella TaxID=5974 RepID=A0A8J8NHR3_HALGN|nr:hypothetical protein FGO68_gene2436 [Halteria grandinella]